MEESLLDNKCFWIIPFFLIMLFIASTVCCMFLFLDARVPTIMPPQTDRCGMRDKRELNR